MEMLRSPSPELENKEDFIASSLWKVAAKANQEDFREVFKNATQQETSEELEDKLKDLLHSQKNKPSMEPTYQVSPRTIKYLCNVIMDDHPQPPANPHTQQHQPKGVAWQLT